jgi:hypothetical protein
MMGRWSKHELRVDVFASQYGEKIAVSFTSDRDILPDPQNLMACLHKTREQIDLLGGNKPC